MNIPIQGLLEDLIPKCDSCDYCIFEHFLSENQRKIKEKQDMKKHLGNGVKNKIWVEV